MKKRLAILPVLAALAAHSIPEAGSASPPAPDRELHVVSTAHLDTQWRWTIRETIDEFLPATLRENFRLFERYPGYVFSFEGAFRYMLMREYFPAEYERMRRYIRDGRWRVAGSWVDAVDTNMPSPESLIRHALYGNGYFRTAFGKTSTDIFLPDCFGFGYALPSIGAHCGITGFSTQKLTWGSAYGVPFDIGLWEGVDGSRLVAALKPGSYVGTIESDLSGDPDVVAKIDAQGETTGRYVGYRYIGTGDQGGSPTEESVAMLEQSLRSGGPVRVRSVGSDQLAREIRADLDAGRGPRLPVYKGELLMTDHGAGCYTSQAAMKTWNRRNEVAADAAERACAIAGWLGGIADPRAELREAWIRFLWHQFHDDLTGTSIPEAYRFSWNDEAISHNQLLALTAEAAGAIASALDTRTEGLAVVVMNPLGRDREEAVEITLPGIRARCVRVYGPAGEETPSQSTPTADGSLRVVFLARVPSVGCAVYDVRPSAIPSPLRARAHVTPRSLENDRYGVVLDGEGNIASIRDKLLGCELLGGPIRLEMLDDEPYDWAAWEIDYDDIMAAPRAVVGSPARVELVESGPARVALRVTRESEGSRFVQTIRLADRGGRIEVENAIDWRTAGALLKVRVPVSAAGEKATYDLGLGSIARPVNTKSLYETPAQRWADLSAPDGSRGVAILSDSRYGWDRPDASTLRLTLIHTPRVNERWNWVRDQQSQDLGNHVTTFAVVGHPGGAPSAEAAWEADQLNQPLQAFLAPRHAGPLGRAFSFVRVVDPAAPGSGWGRPHRNRLPASPAFPEVAITAVKPAEGGEGILVRLFERSGRPGSARLAFAVPVVSARAVNGVEDDEGALAVEDGRVTLEFAPFQPRSLIVRLAAPPARLSPPRSVPVPLAYNARGITGCGERGAGLGPEKIAAPGDRLPERLVVRGTEYRPGPIADGTANVMLCKGQTVPLPAVGNSLYILAASLDGDREADFAVDGRRVSFVVQDWLESIHQWDNRIVGGVLQHEPDRIEPGYLKTQPVGWVGTHRHRSDGSRESYLFTTFFEHRIDIPRGARVLTLPDDPSVCVLAISVVESGNDAILPLGDVPYATIRSLVRVEAERTSFVESTSAVLRSPHPGAVIRYTLDGSLPGPSSPRYRAPLTIDAACRLRARAFDPGLEDTYIADVAFTKLAYRDAARARSTSPGLDCTTYAGTWKKLPEPASLSGGTRRIVPAVGIPEGTPAENYVLVLRGLLNVPADGLYTLHLWSDDGSALLLGGEPFIDNDGLHGRAEVARDAALRAGPHEIEVRHFQGPGDAALELWIEGPGLPLQQVPPAMLVHE